MVLHVPGLTTSITADAASNWDDQWSAGYLTTRYNFLPHRQIKKVSLTESAGGVVGRGGRSSMQTVPVKEWEKSAVDCLDIVADASKIIKIRSWWNQEDVEGSDVLVIRRVFTQFRMGSRDIGWDEMGLGFESAINVKK